MAYCLSFFSLEKIYEVLEHFSWDYFTYALERIMNSSKYHLFCLKPHLSNRCVSIRRKNTVPTTNIFIYVTTSLSFRQKWMLWWKRDEGQENLLKDLYSGFQRSGVTWKTSFKKNQCNLGDDIIQQTKLFQAGSINTLRHCKR